MIEGQGDWIPCQGKFGNLQIVVNIIDHEVYQLQGECDLVISDSVDILKCLTGYSKIIPHVGDDRPIKLTVPSGFLIKPEMTLVAKGYGMPFIGKDQEKSFGDLFINLDITFPDTMDSSLIPLLR